MTIRLEVMRRNAEQGAYGILGKPHILALIDAVEAAAWYWRDPSPDAHENLTQALVHFDSGDKP